jgi:hypothetical protein
MSPVAVAAGPSVPQVPSGAECRVWQRYACHVETHCQPVAARGPQERTWKAKISDISASGLGLVAERRFEPGTGLAIQIPDPQDTEGATYLARVVNVRKRDDGSWFLGMALISHLSADEINRLAGAGEPAAPTGPAVPNEEVTRNASDRGQVISRVRWRDLATGRSRIAQRLLFKGIWPLRERAHVRMRVNSSDGFSMPVEIVVHSCAPEGEEWVIDFSFLHEVGPQVLEWLTDEEP